MPTLRDVITPTALMVNVRALRCSMIVKNPLIVMLACIVTRLSENVKIKYLLVRLFAGR